MKPFNYEDYADNNYDTLIGVLRNDDYQVTKFLCESMDIVNQVDVQSIVIMSTTIMAHILGTLSEYNIGIDEYLESF